METAQARPRNDHGKMSNTKQKSLLTAIAMRGGAATLDERSLFVTNRSQHNVYSQPAVVSGHTERLSQSHASNAVSRVMYHCHERSEHAGGSLQHVQEFTDAAE